MKEIFSLFKKGSMASLTAAIVNFVIGLLKGGAFFLTGNVAMFAEMMHSFGDSINQFFVFVGSSLSKKAPTKRFPFGYGRLVNLVCLFAIVIVAILSYETVKEGINHVIEPLPRETDNMMIMISIGVLAISFILETMVLYKAGKELLQQAGQPYDGLKPLTTSYLHMNRAKPATKLVFMEDTVATVGAVIAIIAILIGQYLNVPVAEGVASVIIGLMMFYIVYKVFMENAAGVLGESDPHMEERMSSIVLNHNEIRDIRKLIVMKEGDDLHVEVVAELDKDHSVERANDIRDEIEEIIMNQNHVADVNLEFEVDDGHRAWPQQLSKKRT